MHFAPFLVMNHFLLVLTYICLCWCSLKESGWFPPRGGCEGLSLISFEHFICAAEVLQMDNRILLSRLLDRNRKQEQEKIGGN